jgi:hypothetical protein
MAAKRKIEKKGDEILKKSSLKLSAVGAILVEGSNRLTYFWKRIIQ